jgi:hypothetical protein
VGSTELTGDGKNRSEAEGLIMYVRILSASSKKSTKSEAYAESGGLAGCETHVKEKIVPGLGFGWV